ncbi:hypothetical protein BD1_14 [Octadecabacter Antarctic BD virus 1]|nr:hypothetical protein BD1_14 [Octadecabacter Antarctic BD virus 1]
MCEPVTMMMIASTALSAGGAIMQGNAASANAKFQQKIALDNADRTSEKMRDAKERGSDREQQVMAEGAVSIANTRGALASNNMDLTMGSPLDTILQASMEVERDAYRVRRNTGYEVADLNQERANFRNNASAQGAEASNARTAGFISGVGTALSGGASAAQHYADIQ